MKKRLLAMFLTVAMIIGMLPVMVFAGGETGGTGEVLPNIMTDCFNDGRYVNGFRYKWENMDNSTSSERLLTNEGHYNLLNMAEGRSNKNHLFTYLTATDLLTGKDYAQSWSDYSVEMTFRVDTFDPEHEDQAVKDALNAGKAQAKMLLMGRVQKQEDGSTTFYAAGFAYEPKVVYLYKCLREQNNAVTFTQLGSVTVDAARDTFYTLKLSFNDDQIHVSLDGETCISVEDIEYKAGTVGFQLNRCGSMTVDSVKVIHDDDSTVFVEEFSDSRYLDGTVNKWKPDADDIWNTADGKYSASIARPEVHAVTSKWKTVQNQTYVDSNKPSTISVSNGELQITNIGGNSYTNYAFAYLSVFDANKDYAASWEDYSVETSLKLTDLRTDGQKQYIALIGGVTEQDDGSINYYKLYCRQDTQSVYLYKCTLKDGTETSEAIGSRNMGIDIDAEYVALKMTFASGKLKAYVDGVDTEFSADIAETHASGRVGVYLSRKGVLSVDYIKVTDLLGNSLFFEDFTDAVRLSDSGEKGYMLGKTYCVGEIPPSEADIDSFEDVTAKWINNDYYPYTTRNVVNAGKLSLTNNATRDGDTNNYSSAYLTLTDANSVDLAKSWTNYSVEMSARVTGLQEADTKRNKLGLIGRLQIDEDGVYSYYKVQCDPSGNIALYRCTIGTNATDAKKEEVAAVGSGFASGVDFTQGITMKLEFTNDKIKVYINGNNPVSFDYDSEKLTAGTIGYQFTRYGSVDIDYFKVTDGNNNLLFSDDFDSATHLDDTGYRCYWWNGDFYARIPTVTLESVTAVPPSVNLFSAVNGTVDYAESWKDYAIETDFLLEENDSAAGIVARATDAGYYELRITKDRMGLWKVTEAGEEELTGAAVTVAVDAWQYAKLEVKGNVIKAYLNGVEKFTYSSANDFAAGTIGLKAARSVKFDNFTVYPPEATEMRKYRSFKFTASDVNGLADWNLQEDEWSVVDRHLNSLINTGVAKAVLGNKRALDNYCAETVVTLSPNSTAGVIGRCAPTGSDYYMFRVNVNTGAELVKVVGGNETPLKSVAFLKLYEDGIKLQPEAAYALKLQMYGNVIEGYIGGKLVLRAEDGENHLTAGTSGIFGSNGVTFKYLTLERVDVVTKITIVDAEGNPVATENDPVNVYLGKVPDIKHTWLKVDYYDGSTEKILLDKTNVAAFDGTTTGEKQAAVEYMNASTVFYYNVSTRATAIEALDQELKQLQIPTSLNEEAAVKALFNRYSDLSYMELEAGGISKEAKDNLFAAMEAIELLRYPELKNTIIVFSDTFDTNASSAQYNSSPSTLTWRPNSGNWYVENGNMLQYLTKDHMYPRRLGCSAIVMDANGSPENWEIRSVSVDVQFIDEQARAGIDFCFGGSNEERYSFNITDKSHRITLGKNNTTLKQIYSDKDVNPLVFEAGVWYNLRVTLDGKGLIKCYVDDRLWIEYQDTPTVTDDRILTHGSVGIYSSENYVRYDNLVVRGFDLDPETTDDYENRFGQDYVGGTDVYEDNFNDEKTEGVVNQNPSHWIELNTEDKWLVKANGENLVYASQGNTKGNSHTWLHVFETNIDFSATIKVTEKGYLPVVALSSRVNADESYIRGGYDFTLQKWFISVRLGADFDPAITYSSEEDTAAAAAFLSDGVELRVKLVGKTIELYVDGVRVHTADAGTKVMPGRVGVYTEQCNVEVDDVVLKLLSGQGRVNDGVLEYYTNTGSSYHSILEMWDEDGNQILLLYQDGVQSISVDGGQTFTPSTMYSSNGFKGNSALELHDGTYINIKTRGGSGKDQADRVVYYSKDGGKTWPEVARIPINKNHTYAQPAEHINEVQLSNDTWRIFYTLTNGTTGVSETYYTDYVEGVENFGSVWYRSTNTPKDFTNATSWNESYVIKITKDTTDINGNQIMAGTLIQYSSHNSTDSVRYSLSYDDGVTWVGDYALPQIPCGDSSCCIKEDPYKPGTYYMVTAYNIPVGLSYNHPRFRVVLLRSDDGLNWEFMADVDRWGEISDGIHGNIMQQVNAYLCITEDYVFPIFSRSDQMLADADHSHNLQIGRMYRFEKAKLDAYDVWPQEYMIPDKAITSIEVVPGKANVTLNDTDPLAGSKIKVYYYNTDPELVDLADVMDLTKDADQSRAFATLPDTSTVGEKTVVVDYKHFRTIYTVNVVEGDAPMISGIENGKTYCGAQTVTVTDSNSDLASVTLNGNAVSLTDGKFTVSAAEGQQTIVATDKAGNATTITVTVNADHTWSATWTTGNEQHWKECTVDGCEATTAKTACSGGEADCQNKAMCETCNKEYGEMSTTHKWATEWTSDGTNHWHKCETAGCNEIKDEAGHTPAQDDGDCTTAIKCTVCQKVTTEAKANHTPAEDDGDCTTAIRCTVCQKVTTAAKESHTGGTATCEHKAKCEVCNAEYGALAAHKGGEATCTDKAKCDVCGEAYGELNADKHAKEAKWTTTADKHAKAYECCGKVVVAEEAHKGGIATCEHKAKCEVCNAEYGELAAHKGGEATCTDKAKCEVCGEAYGEKNADKHTKEAKWATTADKHSKTYECCGKVVVTEEAHEWKDGKCEECGYEAAPGTEQKPIEIPTDKETVKEEAKVEAGAEQHYELDENLAGKVITVKGEGAFVIVDGKKYEAVNGIVEMKLPTKTGKISVIIGNAGTKAGAFSITIATPSEDNSDTGDNATIVLFGSLMALSVLAAGVLMIPGIRKKLIK